MKIETIALPIVRLALTEDLGSGDVTTDALVGPGAQASARIEAREAGVVAGLDVARLAFRELDREMIVKTEVGDGGAVAGGQVVLTVAGKARAILSAERVALNFLQHLSGIASLTARFVKALDGTGVKVRDTRKTLPGLRVLEKYAVLVGGGTNHRFGLFDRVLVKDNHLAAVGSIAGAVRRARRVHGDLPVQVEVKTPEEAEEAARAGADEILLDNMDPAGVRAAIAGLGPSGSGSGRPWVEVSGGITLDNVGAFAQPGVDSVAIGALTHSAPALDLALQVDGIEDRA